ncbi:MAG: hypothetical protein JO063_05955 [Pseudonocardiales bacterium]|nr:hypothetical protein [Pseudonocardiales bacterium]MBV9029044.1 hypothetical protein [Pseudonocardiales bacterium]MBW0009653.1 hypothetical protein [Pseudonocardiales bacterium]
MRNQDTAGPPSVPTPAERGKTVGTLWGRCSVDELLHLLAPRAVLEVAAQGYGVACCGVLLVTENLALRGSGTPCPTCLAGSAS